MWKFKLCLLMSFFLLACADEKKPQGQYDFHSAVCDGDYPVFIPVGLKEFKVNLRAFKESEASSKAIRTSSLEFLGRQNNCLLKYSFKLDSENLALDENISCSGSCEIPLVFALSSYPLARYCDGESKCPITLSCSMKSAFQIHSVDYSDTSFPIMKTLIDVNYGYDAAPFYTTCYVKLKKAGSSYEQ